MIYNFKKPKEHTLLTNHIDLGGKNPSGEEISLNSLYIMRGGKPQIAVMGEFHFERYDSSAWKRELCKMKAAGITIVSSYIFWIFHEEIEGELDFSGNLDIRKFVEDAEKVGLDIFLRIGPWVHAECRNGGFPDWLMKKPYPLRDTNPGYMEKVGIFYSAIYEQVKGHFYKDGGRIIGIQIENEYTNNASHLLALKQLAQSIGYDVPLWTATGWNVTFGAKIPERDFLPIFGGYPEAPWEPHTDKLPPSVNFSFNQMRNDSAIGNDIIAAENDDGWRLQYDHYPFATCELGGGIHVTHTRRPIISGMDIYALSLVKLGSGNNLIGYYMFHGGTNPMGKLSAFNESKHAGSYTDCAVMNYDFQTALSEFGEVREQYRLLNLLHLFVADFGDILAPMPVSMPEIEPAVDDMENLRYCMRSDGKSGFVFVNHYLRLEKLKDIFGAEFNTGNAVFPKIDIVGDTCFIMPFGINMGDAVLNYATAQLVCRHKNTFIFTEIDGITPEYDFADGQHFAPKAGFDSIFEVGGVKVLTLTFSQARFLRRLDGEIYIGDGCDLFLEDGEVKSAGDGSFSGYVLKDGFEKFSKTVPFVQATVEFADIDEPFEPTEGYELQLGCKRKLTWKKITVSGDGGFIEIPFEYDVAQIYVDGKLTWDRFWNGTPWRIPAKRLFGHDCCMVMSEYLADFYREF